MNFSPEYISAMIVRPLRYLFTYYAPDSLLWNSDPKLSQIEIDTINNFNKIPVQVKPRILVSRGQYVVSPTGLTDNMVEAASPWASKGHSESKHQLFINGTAQLMIQARNEGTCEKVLNLVQHFLSWSGPMLADHFGFKSTFIPMAISPCVPGTEDTELFSTSVNLPWQKEEHFQVTADDQIKFKNFILGVVPPSQ